MSENTDMFQHHTTRVIKVQDAIFHSYMVWSVFMSEDVSHLWKTRREDGGSCTSLVLRALFRERDPQGDIVRIFESLCSGHRLQFPFIFTVTWMRTASRHRTARSNLHPPIFDGVHTDDRRKTTTISFHTPGNIQQKLETMHEPVKQQSEHTATPCAAGDKPSRESDLLHSAVVSKTIRSTQRRF